MVDDKQLKQACIDFFAKRNSFTFESFIHGIVFLLVQYNNDAIDKLDLVLDSANLRIKNKNIQQLINSNIFTKDSLEELLWQYINAGIIVKDFKTNLSNEPKEDIFHVTPWGLSVLNDIKPSPYDYEEFLRDLSPFINEETSFYLVQSLECFNKYLFIPSAIMLGIAAENIILDISDIAEKKLAVKDKYRKLLKDNRFNITGHIIAISDFVLPQKQNMPDDLINNLDKEYNCFFEIIRLSRNEAGHPSEIKINRDEAYANYIVFRRFCKKAYELKKWLKEQESI